MLVNFRTIRIALIWTLALPATTFGATISLTNNPDVMVGNGNGGSGGGLLGNLVQIASSVSVTNAGSSDSAIIAAEESRITTWVNDQSSNQTNWEAAFEFAFDRPLDNLRIMPYSPPNNSDNFDWTVSWEPSSQLASFQNSPQVVGEYSLYDEGGRLASGTIASGARFRMDDDAIPSQDANGTVGGDLNIGSPSNPWSIDLPDGVTSVRIVSHVTDGANLTHAREGIGIDFSNVVVAEPVAGPMTFMLVVAAIVSVRKRRSVD